MQSGNNEINNYNNCPISVTSNKYCIVVILPNTFINTIAHNISVFKNNILLFLILVQLVCTGSSWNMANSRKRIFIIHVITLMTLSILIPIT